ncbi:response regulator transcription factor [Paraburkholderia heleia]|uniref:response regulator transcription factor n=1 Tax=Paraburkholderia heleia TaxID=634127 RepID=UPI0009FF2589|nr:response regulator transcription factor [Paraburkholderia heleia]
MIVRVVIIEENLEKAEVLWLSAADCGFKPEIASDLTSAASLIDGDPLPDLVILTASANGGRGVSFLQNVRTNLRTRYVPVVVIGEDETDTACVHALEAGADDYITRRTSAAELFARVNAILRPRQSLTRQPALTVNGLTVHPDSHRIFTSRDGQQVELQATSKEFELLCFLLSRPDEVLSREAILAGAWEHGQPPDTRIVDVLVYRLRNMMLGTASEGTIRTVLKSGYRVVTQGTQPQTAQ